MLPAALTPRRADTTAVIGSALPASARGTGYRRIASQLGVSIVELARAVHRNVIGAVERMTGLEVIEVNVAVTDIQIAGAEDGTEAPVAPAHPRVE